MSKDIFALDFGTTKFCIAALIYKNSIPKLKVISVPARGMYRGMINNYDEASNALNILVEKAESELDVDIRKITIGIAGSHLSGNKIDVETNIENQEINGKKLFKLLEEVEKNNTNPIRELLHIIPIEYKIDDREPTNNPIGFTGKTLHSKYFIIDADKAYVKDVIRLCNSCGLEVTNIFSEPFASSSVSVKDSQKQNGVVVADIGGGTTDGIIFQNNKPVDVFTINIGGSLMNNDLSKGLNIDSAFGESAKIEFGLNLNNDSKLEAKTTHGSTKIITTKDVYPILGARVQELGIFLAKELMKYKGNLGSGLLLTGGGALVKNIDSFLESRFKIPVAKIDPVFDKSETEKDDLITRYATSIGLVNLVLCMENERKANQSNFTKKYFSQFINWIREMT